MSGDDYISKLFLDNEHKLDEMPSDNLWGRIESKLDTSLPGESTQTSSLKVSHSANTAKKGMTLLRLAPYFAAASILLFFISLPFFLNKGLEGTETNPTLAYGDEPELPLEEVPIPESEPLLSAVEQEEEFKKEEETQKRKIEGMIEQPIKTDAKTKVVMKDNSEFELTQEPIVEEVKQAYVIVEPTAANNNTVTTTIDFDDYANAGRNYAPPQAADLSKRETIQKIASEYQDKKAGKENFTNDDAYSAPLRNRAETENKYKTVKKADESLAPPLQIFDWMLGDWIDTEIEGGESHEVWKRVSPTMIECNGYRLNRKGKEKIFEEKIVIYLDLALNQVFMKMPVNDAKEPVLYMLTKFDTEYITFEQKEQHDHPDEVVFQRSIKGFKVIINHNGSFLQSNEQTYFNNRNRVTNVRAIRVLEPTKRK